MVALIEETLMVLIHSEVPLFRGTPSETQPHCTKNVSFDEQSQVKTSEALKRQTKYKKNKKIIRKTQNSAPCSVVLTKEVTLLYRPGAE